MADYCCKVGSAIETYELTVPGPIADDVNEYLAAQWLGTSETPAVGHRQLAEWFNKRLLRKIYVEHDRSVTEARVDSEYEALTGNDDPRRQEVIDDLRRNGIDGEEAIKHFVSRSTMVRHLKNCLDLEKEKSAHLETGESTWELDKIEYGRRKFREGVEQSISSLGKKGRLPGGTEVKIDLPVLLSCPECATRVRLSTALQRGYVCDDHLGTIDDEVDDQESTDERSDWELTESYSS